MFNKILVANRGEIACRILRTCKKRGIKTVVVYEQKDRNSVWYTRPDSKDSAKLSADEATEITSYSGIGEIIDAARKSGAEAIHWGYGFLAENPEAVKACEEANIVSISPNSDIIAMMGHKVSALEAAERAGVPVLSRSGKIQDDFSDEMVKNIAQEIGYPLMLKPSNGGGGIGMFTVRSEDELFSLVKKSRSISARAFATSIFYFERYMPESSHVEVQVLGDHYGNVIHLFERDCSVQRRNQKIIEEAPCLKLTKEQKESLYNYALTLAREVGYTNAGTVEFMVSPEGEIYFIEMNTRLQVEHPITEMITGQDLVALQIDIAAGNELKIRQKDLKVKGHAIEARIYPEESRNGEFVLNSGTVLLYEPPKESPKLLRIDSALYTGYTILSDYEPLMAKVIAGGACRPLAIRRLYSALKDLGIVGVKTNIRALIHIVRQQEFSAHAYTTNFLSEEMLRKVEEDEGEFQEELRRFLNNKVTNRKTSALVKLEADRIMRAHSSSLG